MTLTAGSRRAPLDPCSGKRLSPAAPYPPPSGRWDPLVSEAPDCQVCGGKSQGPPWRSSGQDSLLPARGAWVQSLVGELEPTG